MRAHPAQMGPLALFLLFTGCGNQVGSDDLAVSDLASDLAVTPDLAIVVFPSCSGLAASCGPSGNDSCCKSLIVTGGTFLRGYDVAIDNSFSDQTSPATLSDFRLDKYEITVARFRAFVNSGEGTQLNPPAAGAGAHFKIANSGWDSSWNSSLNADSATFVSALKCDPTWQTWTDSSATNESLPINCITWFEAMAFCAWDGGFLPTDAEWNYAASGGPEQRAYPWSAPASSVQIDCSYANFRIVPASGTFCTDGMTGATNSVGHESSAGDGKWGQSDLAGNVWEWALDSYAPYSNPCDDCADVSAPSATTGRVLRGGSLRNDDLFLRSAVRNYSPPSARSSLVGARCARMK